MESKRLLERLDEHIETMADFVKAAEDAMRMVGRTQRAKGEALQRREAHIECLAKLVVGVPVDRPLPDPSQKFNIIRRAIREWRDYKMMEVSAGLREAAKKHQEYDPEASPVRFGGGGGSGGSINNSNNLNRRRGASLGRRPILRERDPDSIEVYGSDSDKENWKPSTSTPSVSSSSNSNNFGSSRASLHRTGSYASFKSALEDGGSGGGYGSEGVVYARRAKINSRSSSMAGSTITTRAQVSHFAEKVKEEEEDVE
jgi:hypothetical protein